MKRTARRMRCFRPAVTPRAGVWIETLSMLKPFAFVMSLPVRECGLKRMQILYCCRLNLVTPRAGVWIETSRVSRITGIAASLPVRECGLKLYTHCVVSVKYVSLPVRECGLKRLFRHNIFVVPSVTPRAGVWIETNL